MHSEKIEGKFMKEVYERIFFLKLQVGILQLHYRLTSSQTVFRNFKKINAFESLLLDLVHNA